MAIDEQTLGRVYIKEPLSFRTTRTQTVEMPLRFIEILQQKIDESQEIPREIDRRLEKSPFSGTAKFLSGLGNKVKQARYQTPQKLIKAGITEQVRLKLDSSSSVEKIKNVLADAFSVYDLALKPSEKDELARAFKQVGLLKLHQLPEVVVKRLEEARKLEATEKAALKPAEKQLENFVPTSAKIAKLSPQSQVLARVGQAIPAAESEAFPPNDPFVLKAHGIKAEDIQETITSLQSSMEKPGLNTGEIEQAQSIIDQYQLIRQRLVEFEEKHPKIAKALDRFSFPGRLKGWADEKVQQISQKLGLPGLKLKPQEPVQMAPPAARTAIGKVLEPTGLVKKVALDGGQITYTSAIKDFLANVISGGHFKNFASFEKAIITPAKKIFAYLGQTAVGKAVINLGKAAAKEAGKLAVSLAAKLGIKLTAASISAFIPGLNFVATTYLTYDSIMDMIEAIPVIGKPLGWLVTALTGPLGGIRKGFKALWSVITLKKLRQGLKQLQEGDVKGAFNIAIGLLPFIALGAAIFGPLFFVGGVILVGAALLIVNLGVIVPAVTAGVAAVGAGITAVTITFIGFMAALPTIITIKRIVLPIVIVLLILGFLTVFIVVLISGGAFLVNPQASPITTVGGSTYIRVEKTANPTAIANDRIPGATVSYTITITATTAQLTNVRVENVTQIIKPGGGTFTIRTAQDNSSITGWTVASPINSGQSYTITYTVILDSSHVGFTDPNQIRDAWLTDTVTVTADVTSPSLTGQRQSASAQVKIGSPAASFPTGWPVGGCVFQGPGASYSHSSCNCIDITCNPYQAVHATHDGEVYRWSQGDGPLSSIYGNYAIVYYPQRSGYLYYTIYGHLMADGSGLPASGTTITAGTIIGYVGNTSSNPGYAVYHLHYELGGNPGLGSSINLYVDPDIPSQTFDCSACNRSQATYWVDSSW